jgi:hypothetical protein
LNCASYPLGELGSGGLLPAFFRSISRALRPAGCRRYQRLIETQD